MDPQLYQRYDTARENALNNWLKNFVSPYGSAYTNARGSFLYWIDEQKKADQKAAEAAAARAAAIGTFAMFALSVAGGSILTVVFGTAVAKVAAGKIATDVICKYEMNRAFKLAHFVSTNKTAQLAVGELFDKGWEKGTGYLSDRVKKLFEETDEQFPQLNAFAAEPQTVQNNLDEWVRNLYGKVLAAGSDIDANVRDDTAKTAGIITLMEAPFFRAAPEKRLNQDLTQSSIELAFWMKLLLDLDYIDRGMVAPPQPVAENPSSSSYPRPMFREPGKFPGHPHYAAVQYHQVGSIIQGRIDSLFKARFKRPFFGSGEKTSLAVLKRAESTLGQLGHDNAGLIRKNLLGYYTGTVSGY